MRRTTHPRRPPFDEHLFRGRVRETALLKFLVSHADSVSDRLRCLERMHHSPSSQSRFSRRPAQRPSPGARPNGTCSGSSRKTGGTARCRRLSTHKPICCGTTPRRSAEGFEVGRKGPSVALLNPPVTTGTRGFTSVIAG